MEAEHRVAAAVSTETRGIFAICSCGRAYLALPTDELERNGKPTMYGHLREPKGEENG